jgi:ankyrin repeat protein
MDWEIDLVKISESYDLNKLKDYLNDMKNNKISLSDEHTINWAYRNNHHKLVELMIKKYMNFYTEDDFNLYLASFYGNIDEVKKLIDKGVDIHANDSVALTLTSMNGHLDIVKLFLKYGIYTYGELGNCMSYSREFMNEHIRQYVYKIKKIQKNKFKIFINENDNLINFIKHNDVDKVKDILNNKKLDIFDDYAFNIACYLGNLEIVKIFLEKNINIFKNDNHALKISSENKNFNVTKLLLEFGADVKAEDNYALRYSLDNIKDIEMAKLLLEHGADITFNNYEVIRNLICKDSDNNDDIELIKILINNNKNPNKNIEVLLEFAINVGYIELVDFLLNDNIVKNINNNLLLSLTKKFYKLRQ